jgi:hypothetical protein
MRHLEVTGFQKKPISSRAVATVVVGRATAEASKALPKVKPTAAVPVTAIRKVSPFRGVPARLEVNEVIAAV